ncbi:hypothetical protein LQZ18_01570 [Lachnospiraceae bacterium ZAX-1]
MANKLKQLKITSTDLVDQGANQDAHIRLFKRKEDEPPTDNNEGILQKIFEFLKRMNTKIDDEENEKLTKSIQKEETDTMKIDKSKMSPEEKTTLEDFEKKYGIQNEPETTPTADVAKATDVTKSADTAQTDAIAETSLHPEVKKALTEYKEICKAQTQEMEELRKSLSIEKLTSVAKKYESIGKKADELAPKLYEMQKTGGTVYADYVALLDEQLNLVEKSGMFSEIGKSTEGSAGAKEALSIAATEITKTATDISSTDAVVKAWENNPELAAQYENEYKGGK